jgi:hypothetical protein
MDENNPFDEPLPYPTRPLFFPNGECVEEFIIPEEDREIVLEQLYPFSPVPELTDVMYDLHADKTFVVKDFRVTREHGMNYLVSPYYPESGGTVIDWVDEDWATEAGDEPDPSEDTDELDDPDLSDFDQDPDDHLPF